MTRAIAALALWATLAGGRALYAVSHPILPAVRVGASVAARDYKARGKAAPTQNPHECPPESTCLQLDVSPTDGCAAPCTVTLSARIVSRGPSITWCPGTVRYGFGDGDPDPDDTQPIYGCAHEDWKPRPHLYEKPGLYHVSVQVLEAANVDQVMGHVGRAVIVGGAR